MYKEKNILIAEFMGGKKKKFDPLFGGKYEEIDTTDMECYVSLPKYVGFGALKYNKEWSWLMPVVDKVEDMGAEIVMTNEECSISFDEYFEETSGVNRFGALYWALTRFIQHLKENK